MVNGGLRDSEGSEEIEIVCVSHVLRDVGDCYASSQIVGRKDSAFNGKTCGKRTPTMDQVNPSALDDWRAITNIVVKRVDAVIEERQGAAREERVKGKG